MRCVDCMSCDTVAGRRQPPGGIVYQDDNWAFFLRSRPLLLPGQGFIVLKRHCERLNELTPMELQTLGPMMQRVEIALDRVLQPAKVHFGLYAESVRHIHLHVLPRMPTMPAGNIPITILHAWYDLLAHLRLKRPYPDSAVAGAAHRLRDVMISTNL
jgi:diadenosine tetraphosphate (Ap4A) HIT family hydrolase